MLLDLVAESSCISTGIHYNGRYGLTLAVKNCKFASICKRSDLAVLRVYFQFKIVPKAFITPVAHFHFHFHPLLIEINGSGVGEYARMPFGRHAKVYFDWYASRQIPA